ncbi:aldehyde dehydrogenase family protein [Dokdonella sp.]|uniref:aldehyde dehydrogenase family protein n=1 Tax=Dokdonella sp. TaxID=2291710 RepID=UPI001B126FC3|nr:aldehyde dehydrogenase family protein [Dokdonella sp.]MBO9661336.1 aldehyde dehydrogenase family protein [Dokdonella sp.]
MAVVAPLLVAGRWRAARDHAGSFRAVDPASGQAIGPEFPRNGAADLEEAVAAAADAATVLAAAEPARVAAFLDAYAVAIDTDAEALVELAHAETALPAPTRLRGNELPRTSSQLRQAARAAREYAWTQPAIDTAAGLRSHFAPLGKPVLIFGPNNFPFAFNAVSGGDFAAAIAARNPVIAKAHPSHPATSRRLAEHAHRAAAEAGLPPATVQLLYDFEPAFGLDLAGDARLGAIAFTGSRAGGLALKQAADRAGIPFYGELSSLNPVFLLPGALAERGEALAEEFAASCLLGSGQFCTNPGLVAVPPGAAGDAFVAAAQARFAAATPMLLLSRAVLASLERSLAALCKGGATPLCGGTASGEGVRYAPTLLQVAADDFLRAAHVLQTEAFGPASLLVRCANLAQMQAVARALEGQLTGTIYRAVGGSDDALWQTLAAVLRPRVGRLIANKMPTGVLVSPAQQHGGPYPAATHPGFTAVGLPASIHRFAALHAYDNVPDALLPSELRDENPGGIVRRIDGHSTLADVGAAP